MGHPGLCFIPIFWIGELVGEDGAVADLAFFDLVNGGVGLGHGEEFSLGFDAMARGNVEHLLESVWAAGGVAADGAEAADERKGMDADR